MTHDVLWHMGTTMASKSDFKTPLGTAFLYIWELTKHPRLLIPVHQVLHPMLFLHSIRGYRAWCLMVSYVCWFMMSHDVSWCSRSSHYFTSPITTQVAKQAHAFTNPLLVRSCSTSQWPHISSVCSSQYVPCKYPKLYRHCMGWDGLSKLVAQGTPLCMASHAVDTSMHTPSAGWPASELRNQLSENSLASQYFLHASIWLPQKWSLRD